MTNSSTDPLDAPTAALAAAVLEIARHIGDTPLPRVRFFALASTAQLLARQPGLASLLGAQSAGVPTSEDLRLTSIELDEGSDSSPNDPLQALAHVQWPDIASGGVLACDLAPEQWTVRAHDTHTGTEPETDCRALRVVVAALDDGTSWSALQRAGDREYTLGAALLPELTAALQESLQPPG